MKPLKFVKHTGLIIGTAWLASGIASVAHSATPTTPIEHVIVVVGENHTFDNIFGVYRPNNGQTVLNLLSQGIVDGNGNPGPNFPLARQHIAMPPGTGTGNSTYSIDPQRVGTYATLPQPNTTYATGQPLGVADSRFPDDLKNGPFQISKYAPYDAFTGDPVHRFFQMWQQVSKGKNDLFVWVAQTAGTGNHTAGDAADDTAQGALAMGFYNMETGDAPFFKEMARHYAISDNYHQAIMGGTGANFQAIVSGDAVFFQDGTGTPQVPPTMVSALGTTVSQIENPNPQPAGSNPNWYTEDGYSGGSYVNCADATKPGVKAILDYLAALHVKPNCEPNHYYLVNNYNMGYTPNGVPVDRSAQPFTLPPQQGGHTIADALSAANVSWKYYIGGRGADGSSVSADYCGICDPLTGYTSVMADPAKRANLQDLSVLYSDVQGNSLPAVSFVRPLETMAGHPADSIQSSYENFVTDLVNIVHRNPDVWKSTVIILTEDEGGGYYDSGYVQPLDFFGDGTRIPLIIVSPYAREGFVDHTYSDHVSILKFIERNWGLKPLSARSRDNLPNPIQNRSYQPNNGPAIGDLMSAFDFHHFRQDAPFITVSGDSKHHND